MKQNLLTKVLLLCALIVGSSSVAWAARYNKVTTLTSGKSYIVVSGGYAITASASDNWVNKTDVSTSINNNTGVLTTTATDIVWVMTSSGTGNNQVWTFKCGNIWLINNSGSTYRNMSVGTSYSGTQKIEYKISNNKIYSTGSTSKYLQCMESGYRMYGSNQSGAIVTFDFYEKEDDKELSSLAISGTPTKTTYTEGETFDPTGLVVTATYTDSSSDDVTSIASFNCTPSVLEYGTTSVSVVATVGNINSSSYPVNVTVNEATKYTVTISNDIVNGTLTIKNGENNVPSGTKVIPGTTLTIISTPDPGYRFKNWQYTIGTQTNTRYTNPQDYEMPDNDVTFKANFELIPTPTITITPTDDGTITVKNGNAVVSSGTALPEGTELTIVAEAGEGKEFASWSVTGATPASTTDAETTITVGNSDINIAALFNTVPTHKISWSVNGVVVKEENIKEGNAITFAAPESEIPTGYIYTGWSAAEILTPQNTAPTFVTSATSAADVTYYAVLAIGSSETAQLTASHTTNNTTYGSHSYTDNKNNTWSGNTNEPYENNVARIGLRATSGSYLESPTFPGNVTEIKMMTYNGSSTSDRTFNLKSTKDGTTADLGTVNAPKGKQLTEEQTAVLTGTAFKKFFIVPSDPVAFSYIKVTYMNATDYCTTIPPVTANITAAGYATFSSFTNVDFSANEDLTVFTAKQNGTSITLTEVDSKKVPANTAVILKGEGGDFNGTVVATADALENNDLQIAEEDMNGSSGKIYVLNKVDGVVGFYKLSANGTLTKGKAYLEAESEAPYFGFDGEGTTGIQNIERTVIDNQYYTLDGRRVAEPKKGLYIINGKKVVIK